VPLPIPVASPDALIVATDALLERHVACEVTSTVAPFDVVPTAMNCVVCEGTANDWVPGTIASETTPPPPDGPDVPLTARVAVAEVAPAMLAVMVTVPAETPVAMPDALMVAMSVELDFQVTMLVTSWVVDGCLP
jgi:hypothetical protein